MEYSFTYWKDVYSKSKVTMEPSSFAHFCTSYLNKGDTLLDICNGNGRDSIFFEKCDVDVTSFDCDTLNLEDKIPKFGLDEVFNAAYCRFVLHAIPEDLENYVLQTAYEVIRKGGLLFIEVRSDKGTVLNDHYRRLINLNKLKAKLFDLNFKVEFELEQDNLSVYNNENPVLIRIIARKIGILNPVDCRYMLLNVKRILDTNKIPFFLVFGTLLGAYREQRFIPHDKDVDIGLFINYKSKVKRLIDKGIFKKYGLHYTGDNFKLFSTFRYKEEEIDLFYFNSSTKPNDEKISPANSRYVIAKYGPLKDIAFLGTTFKTVTNVEDSLVDSYGEDWKTPKKWYGALNW